MQMKSKDDNRSKFQCGNNLSHILKYGKLFPNMFASCDLRLISFVHFIFL